MTLLYYNNYRTFVKKQFNLESVKKWADNCIFIVNNGGNRFVVVKSYQYDPLIGKPAIQYKRITSIKAFMSNHNFNCQCLVDYKTVLNRFGSGKYGVLQYMFDNELFKSYPRVLVYPYLKIKGAPNIGNCFNKWTGFSLEDEKHNNLDFTKSCIYKHIVNDFCNYNIIEANHLFDWVADIIQKPYRIPGTAHVFKSIQGCGKNLFSKFLSKLVDKNRLLIITNHAHYFKTNFNAEQEGVLIKVFEEAKSKGASYTNADRLKAEITNDYNRIEPKGQEVIQTLNFSRCLFYTNNDDAMFIENTDRRYTMHNISDKHAQNMNYFKKIVDEIDNKLLMKSAFDWFANRKYEEFNVMTTFETAYKKDQKLSSLPNALRFIIDLFETNNIKITKYNDDKVKTTDVNKAYQDWCTENGCNFSVRSFKTQLKKIGLVSKTKRMDKYTTSKGYILNRDAIEKQFQKYLQDTSFKFEVLSEEILNLNLNGNDDLEIINIENL